MLLWAALVAGALLTADTTPVLLSYRLDCPCATVQAVDSMPEIGIAFSGAFLQHGDVTNDGNVNASDIIRLVSYVFHGGPKPDVPDSVKAFFMFRNDASGGHAEYMRYKSP